MGKVGLKFNIQKTKILASGPVTSRHIDEETMETVTDFIFGGDWPELNTCTVEIYVHAQTLFFGLVGDEEESINNETMYKIDTRALKHRILSFMLCDELDM